MNWELLKRIFRGKTHIPQGKTQPVIKPSWGINGWENPTKNSSGIFADTDMHINTCNIVSSWLRESSPLPQVPPGPDPLNAPPELSKIALCSNHTTQGEGIGEGSTTANVHKA